MSAEAQTAVLQELLDQGYQFRLNAALKNGDFPMPVRNVIGQGTGTSSTEAQPAPDTPAGEPIQPATPPVATPDKPASSTLKTVGIASAAGLGTLGTLFGLNHLLSQPAAQPPATNPPAVVQPADGDLIKWLQGHGYNRPGG